MTPKFSSEIISKLHKRTILWYTVWFFLFVAIPCLLLQMQENIINGINSGTILPDTTLFLYYTNTTHPTISSLFLTNYVHNLRNWSHFLNNIEMYIGILLLIFIFETLWIFYKDDERSEREFYLSLILFFFGFSILYFWNKSDNFSNNWWNGI